MSQPNVEFLGKVSSTESAEKIIKEIMDKKNNEQIKQMTESMKKIPFVNKMLEQQEKIKRIQEKKFEPNKDLDDFYIQLEKIIENLDKKTQEEMEYLINKSRNIRTLSIIISKESQANIMNNYKMPNI